MKLEIDDNKKVSPDNILKELQAKDLGYTGYVTIKELSSALQKALNVS